MPKKDNLQEAIERQAASLDPAQREFVLTQFTTYQWNANRISELEGQLEGGVFREDGTRNFDAEGKLFRQRHQIVAEQNVLFSHIMRWLKGTAAQESELDKFL